MRSKEIDLSGSDLGGRGRNGWLNVTRIQLIEYPSHREGEGPRVSVGASSSKPYRNCAPIMLEGPRETMLEVFEAVVGFLKGVD